MSNPTEKTRFSERFALLCDENGIPAEGKGRQKAVAKKWGVSGPAAFKWLRGEAIPEVEKCIEIAKGWKVRFEWLMTGRGEKDYTDTAPDIAPRVMELAKWLSQMKDNQLDVLETMMKTPAVDDDDARLAGWKAPDHPKPDHHVAENRKSFQPAQKKVSTKARSARK